jgi:hypothetical protein
MAPTGLAILIGAGPTTVRQCLIESELGMRICKQEMVMKLKEREKNYLYNSF